ncbi:MAG: inositol monophosphatase family protein, partial [Verrucomicrobiia bacterium]
GALHGNAGLRMQSGFQSAQVNKLCQLTEKEIATALEAAVKAACAAGSRMRNNLNRTKQANKISHHDVKLALDVECQDIITRQLRRAFPSIPVVGEEGVSGRLDADFRWIIDPIDGTVNFFHGIPHAAVSIALHARCESNKKKKTNHAAGAISIAADRTCEDGCKTVVGAVYDPFLDELWTAVAGQPTRLNGKKVCVSAHNRLADAMVSMGFGKQPSLLEAALPVFGELSFKARKVRITGSAALALAYVACGRFDAHIGAGIRLWDVAAGSLLVECAGGKVQMNCLTPGRGGTIIAVNSGLEAPVLRLAAGLM